MTVMAQQQNSAGWQNYPLNLRSYDPLQQNGECYSKRLKDPSNKLFSKKASLRVFEAKADGNGRPRIVNCNTESELDAYLKEDDQKVSRMFYIPRRHSWGPLEITMEMFQKLLSHLEIFPGFLDIVFELGRRKQSSEGCTPTFTDSRISFDSWELCYGLYYVERHGRPQLEDPWSMRQTGIYQKHNSRKWESIWCLLHPSSGFQSRMEEVHESIQLRHRDSLRRAGNVHLLLVSSTAENWGLYSAYLEETFAKMSEKAVHSTVSNGDDQRTEDAEKLDFEITFRDSQVIQGFQEKVQGAISALQSNYDIISSLQKKLKPFWAIDANWVQDMRIADGSQISGDPLDLYLSQYEVSLGNARSLLVRVQAVSNLIHKIHEFRNLRKLQEYNKNMVNLGRGSVSEAGAMRVITVITLVYLPATFVATVFGMGCINVQRTDSRKLKVTVTIEFWAYLTVTAIFMLVTGATWYLYNNRVKKKAKKIEDELTAV